MLLSNKTQKEMQQMKSYNCMKKANEKDCVIYVLIKL